MFSGRVFSVRASPTRIGQTTNRSYTRSFSRDRSRDFASLDAESGGKSTYGESLRSEVSQNGRG